MLKSVCSVVTFSNCSILKLKVLIIVIFSVQLLNFEMEVSVYIIPLFYRTFYMCLEF